MTCWRGVSHATPGKSQANPSRHSNAARIAVELELAELELLKFIVTPSHSKLSTVPTPRHSNAARIARRSDWRNWASPRCHATPRHRARPSESLQPGLPPAVDVSTSEKTELEITLRSRPENCFGLAQFRSNSSPVSRATPRSRPENCFGLAQLRSNSSPVSDATPRHSILSNSKICLTPCHPIPTRNGVTNSTPHHDQPSPQRNSTPR